ncbi:Predicted oxidoreductase [Marivirga sericea]|uniref:Predicted oxidoreductase n=1 Tax=Marivirga sericea TaxID=1028 RepID=A0A1X7J7H2_9BACT|nr:aldo/keto reductase [Marivirga sericea]SMG23519.1 Predicted oxidoreductase [Marivirga sericea]
MTEKKLILGTVQFGIPYGVNNLVGQPSKQEIFTILKKAYEHGIRTLDTAAAYGNSEKLIGDFLQSNPEMGFKIITKIKTDDSVDFEKSLTASLTNLKIDSVNTILFHSFTDFKKNINKHRNSINKHKGNLFEKIGVSIYDNNEIIELLDNDLIDVIQAPFNLLDNKTQRGHLFKELQSKGKIVHTRSSFLQGLFFMNKEVIPKGLSPLIPFLDEIKKLCNQYDISVQELSLNYVLNKKYIDGVLFGVDNVSQLNQNMANINPQLPEDLINAIDEINVIDNFLLNPSKWKI